MSKGIWGGEYYTSWQEQMEIERGIVLQSGKIGDLSTLHWVEKAQPAESGIPVTVSDTQIFVHVHIIIFTLFIL